MTNAEAEDEVLTAEMIRAVFVTLASKLGDAATLTFEADRNSEVLALTPANRRSVPISFEYDTGSEGAGEVRFDLAGADEPVYEIDYMLELADAAIAGRVIVVEDWLRREVLITDSSGEQSSHQVTGVLGALLFNGNWRRRARSSSFEPYHT